MSPPQPGNTMVIFMTAILFSTSKTEKGDWLQWLKYFIHVLHTRRADFMAKNLSKSQSQGKRCQRIITEEKYTKEHKWNKWIIATLAKDAASVWVESCENLWGRRVSEQNNYCNPYLLQEATQLLAEVMSKTNTVNKLDQNIISSKRAQRVQLCQ